MRTGLSVDDLGGFLDEPRVAVLATLRPDGSVLLSPIWYEWRDGGFNLWVEEDNAKTRHLRRDPRATIVVAESEPPLRGVELRGTAQFIDQDVTPTAHRIEPGHLRVWDFADEYPTD
jgi:PPOX class probable F420-dependent enzyme